LALGCGVVALAQAGSPPTKVGIIHIQNAIIQTKDGQKAAQDIDARFGPRQKEADRKGTELQTLETQYRNGANTMSEEAKSKLAREIELKRKLLQRHLDDARTDLEQEQRRVLDELGQKMMVVIDKYAADHGYAVILDVSTQQSGVLYASNTIDITREIVDLYDKNSGLPAPAAPAAEPAKKP
jgi:outer membrane protein